MQDGQRNDSQLTQELAYAFIKERRAERRWKNIRFFLIFMIICFVIWQLFRHSQPVVVDEEGAKGYVALVYLDGMIAPQENFSAESVVPVLQEAFSDANAKGVVLDINSGGGTPVQASIIHDAIVSLKKKYHKKVIVVGEDLLASGAYFVAVAADKIYVNPNTITGSIGVIMKGFGFPDLIKKVGIERRVYTAGVNKDRLDPFLVQNQEDIHKIETVISEVHQNFIQIVTEGRKGKLHGDLKELFSGDFWSGQTAVKLGLVDGLGNLHDVIQKEFHVSQVKDYSDSKSFLKSFASQLGASLGAGLTSTSMKLVSMT